MTDDPPRTTDDLRHKGNVIDQRQQQIDRVLDDVALGLEVGEDAYRGVGDENGFRVPRHVHDKDVADTPLRPKARAR